MAKEKCSPDFLNSKESPDTEAKKINKGKIKI